MQDITVQQVNLHLDQMLTNAHLETSVYQEQRTHSSTYTQPTVKAVHTNTKTDSPPALIAQSATTVLLAQSLQTFAQQGIIVMYLQVQSVALLVHKVPTNRILEDSSA